MSQKFVLPATSQCLASRISAAGPRRAIGLLARAVLLSAVALAAACGGGVGGDSTAAADATALPATSGAQASAPVDPTTTAFYCSFANGWQNCGFGEQAKALPRATLVTVSGVSAVRLHTEPGDDNIYGSGTSERNDLSTSQATTDGYEGKEQWWAHSVLFPNDYVDPPESSASSWNFGAVADFHNTTNGGGQANFQITAMPATAISLDRPTGLNFQINHGSQTSPTQLNYPIGPVVRNQWYNFVYH
ncbi:MAG: heparin lyase I family protein, partial [Burkholderiales bacterium]